MVKKFSGLLAVLFFLTSGISQGASFKAPSLSARSAVIMGRDGQILFSKNPHLRLAPASTTKLMTALIALEKLPMTARVAISRRATNVENSKAGLTAGASYLAGDLVVASLVSSSNDAAVALAEAVAGSEEDFAILMNEKAAILKMQNTRFVNATGLPDKKRKQYSTAYDLSLLMRQAVRDKRIDRILGVTQVIVTGSDKKPLFLRSHNKMLWRTPGYIKGKTGWTFASRHTFVGTNFAAQKTITFAMLSSKEPWTDIRRLANFGTLLQSAKY